MIRQPRLNATKATTFERCTKHMASEIFELLKSQDLDELHKELKRLEAKRDAAIAEIYREIATIKQVIKIVELAKNGKPARKPFANVSATESRSLPAATQSNVARVKSTYCDKAAIYLDAAGEASIGAICRGIGHDNEGSLKVLMSNDSRFLKTEKGTYRLRGAANG